MGRNIFYDKIWELDLAQQLLMRRLTLLKGDTCVQGSRYTQKAVACAIGVTQPCVTKWEYGEGTPNDWKTWQKWANHLNSDFDIVLKERQSESEDEIAVRNIQQILEET
jgi:DNA-binding XRE family transcriptional regulator